MISGLRMLIAIFVALALIAGPASAQHQHPHPQQKVNEHDPNSVPGSHDDHAHGEIGIGGIDEHDLHSEDAHGEAVHGEEHHADGHHDEHHGGSKVPELPNLVGVLHHSFPAAFAPLEQFAESVGMHDPLGTPFTALESLLFAALAIILLSLFFYSAYRRLRVAPPAAGRLSRRATFVEIIALFFEDFFGAILGREEVRRHLPLIGTLFIYILTLNSMGLIFLGKAPTANLSFNLGMALCVVVYVHGFAMRKSFSGYLAHYPGTYPSMRELGLGPIGALLVGFIIILFTIIHIMEAVIQPVSLSLRLFGNLLGKDVLLGVFGDLIPFVPLHTPFLFLGLLLGAIQALIFSLLTAVYITLWLPHEHHHDEHHDDHHGEPAAGHA